MEAPDADKDPIKVQIHDKQVEELERSLDPPLNVLFIRQLLTLRDKVRKDWGRNWGREGVIEPGGGFCCVGASFFAVSCRRPPVFTHPSPQLPSLCCASRRRPPVLYEHLPTHLPHFPPPPPPF